MLPCLFVKLASYLHINKVALIRLHTVHPCCKQVQPAQALAASLGLAVSLAQVIV